MIPTNAHRKLGLTAILFGLAASAYAAGCDLNGDNVTNVTDVQQCVNQAIGIAACSTGELNADAQCNVIDVQLEVNAALGGRCPAGGTGGSRCPAFPSFPDASC